jgi:hypothetical protein
VLLGGCIESLGEHGRGTWLHEEAEDLPVIDGGGRRRDVSMAGQ